MTTIALICKQKTLQGEEAEKITMGEAEAMLGMMQVDSIGTEGQMKKILQLKLKETKSFMHTVGKMGEQLVMQQQSLQEQLSQLQASDTALPSEMRHKLVEMADGFNEVARYSHQVLSSRKSQTFPKQPGVVAAVEKENEDGILSVPSSPTKKVSRRGSRKPNVHGDIEFAAEVGQNLIEEVRVKQAIIEQKQEALKAANEMVAQLQSDMHNMESQLKQLHASEEVLRDENWNMAVKMQDLSAELTDKKSQCSRLQNEAQRLVASSESQLKGNDDLASELTVTKDSLSLLQHKYDQDMAVLRSESEDLRSECIELSQAAKEHDEKMSMLRREFEEKAEGAHVSPTATEPKSPQITPIMSPAMSPIKNTPSRNESLEQQTMKTSLDHAYKIINGLRSNLYKGRLHTHECESKMKEMMDELSTLKVVNRKGAAASRGQAKKLKVRPGRAFAGKAKEEEIEVLNDDEMDLTATTSYYSLSEEAGDSAVFNTATERSASETDNYYETLEGAESDTDSVASSATERSPSKFSKTYIAKGLPTGLSAFDGEMTDNSPQKRYIQRPRKASVIKRKSSVNLSGRTNLPLFAELAQNTERDIADLRVSPLIHSAEFSPTLNKKTSTAFAPLLALREEYGILKTEKERLVEEIQNLKHLENQVITTKSYSEELEIENENLKNTLAQYNEDLLLLGSQKTGVSEQLIAMEEHAKETSRNYQKQVEELVLEKQELLKEIQLADRRNKHAQATSEALQQARTDVLLGEERYAGLEREYERLSLELSQEQNIRDAPDQYGQNKKLQQELEAHKASLEQLTQEFGWLSDEKTRLTDNSARELQIVQSALNKQVEELTLVKKHSESLAIENKVLRNQIAQLKASISTLEGKIRAAQGEVSSKLSMSQGTMLPPPIGGTNSFRQSPSISAQSTISSRPQFPPPASPSRLTLGSSRSLRTSNVGRVSLSRTSSATSFASAVDHHFGLRDHFNNQFSVPSSTDPVIVRAVTQAMIGEYLHKYTRKTGRREFSDQRHSRYFTINPYTRTIHWSVYNPVGKDLSEVASKSGNKCNCAEEEELTVM